MFEVENLNEFINRMFDNAIKSNNDVKVGLTTLKKYLEDTSMCTDEYLTILSKIIECSSELLELKRKMNDMDVVFFVEYTLNNQNKVVQPKENSVGQKKKNSRLSGSCVGGSYRQHSTYSGSCGVSTPSYSSSCGGGSYTSRC